MTPRGIVRCALCRTDAYGLPDHKLEGVEHVSARWGDGGKVQVIFEGEDVTTDAYEAVAGRNGSVYLFDKNTAGHRYACPVDGTHAVVVKHSGRVSVLRRPDS
jgi:hypothetical protein